MMKQPAGIWHQPFEQFATTTGWRQLTPSIDDSSQPVTSGPAGSIKALGSRG
jgi:hypothetical protein